MRVLGIGARVDLGDLYAALMREGHEVKVFADDPAFTAVQQGFVDRVEDWRAELPWVGKDGVILFEKVGQGAQQDALRAEGYQVVGGSTLGDRLEYDRGFGQQALREAGLPIAPSFAFEDAAAAAEWLRAHPSRMVVKHFNNARATYVGDHAQGLDVLYQLNRAPPPGGVLLMPVIEGVEVGVGAYFDGQHFLEPACIDFEHKRFFPGDIGEMTGEMGTLVSYRGSGPIMRATLGRMEPMFRDAGHVGYVNLNMIANEQGLWPLEFTCRFGNPGYAILAPLQVEGWGGLLTRMVEGGTTTHPTRPGWCIGIVLTIPPFPEERPYNDIKWDAPLLFHTPMDDPAHYHFSDMRLTDGELWAGRRTGYTMVVTGDAPTIPEAQAAALARARSVCVPDLRYRADIGAKALAGDLDRLRTLGWFDA